jgi:hypothetical protein
MSDLYNSILQLVRQNGIREYENEYKRVLEYLKEEARYLLRDEINEVVKEGSKIVNEVNEISIENNVLDNINNIINGISETLNEGDNVKVINLEAEKESSDVKNKQRAKEKARREYMKANNIDITELFTVDNVRKWLNDGRSYAWIASEQLGCKQEEVSRFVKMNKIK